MKNIICKAYFVFFVFVFFGGGGDRGQRLDNNGFVPCSTGVNSMLVFLFLTSSRQKKSPY